MTLSMMSRLSTPPLRPAPETACSDVITTVSTPKVLTSGAREIASPTVVQFGFGAIKPFQMATKGVLVRIGFAPNTELFREQLQVNAEGYVVVNGEQETSVANVFATGDVANPLAPTISGAVGAGATAAKVIASRLKH